MIRIIILLTVVLLFNSCATKRLPAVAEVPVSYFQQVDISIYFQLVLKPGGDYAMNIQAINPFSSTGKYEWKDKNTLILIPSKSLSALGGDKWVTTKYKLKDDKLILQNGRFKRMFGSLELEKE